MALGNKYFYALVDYSYIISRNVFACSSGKKPGEYNEGDVIKITIQTMNKVARDFGITADKVIFLADKWDPSINGYIRHNILKDYVAYKGTRKWMTERELENMRSDPNVTPEELAKAVAELYQNQVKSKAKKAMMAEFKNLGMPVLGLEGYEADDLAWISSCMLYGNTGNKKSVVITKDGDWKYFLSPYMDYFKIPTGGSQPQIITYEEMCAEIPQQLVSRGVGLYQYNAFMNSLGFSHNDNLKTMASGVNSTDAILHILDGNYNDVANVPAFNAQMESFDVTKFPRFEEAKKLITDHFAYDGKIGGTDVFHDFCSRYNVSGISDKYYSDFVGRFDQKLYSER